MMLVDFLHGNGDLIRKDLGIGKPQLQPFPRKNLPERVPTAEKALMIKDKERKRHIFENIVQKDPLDFKLLPFFQIGHPEVRDDIAGDIEEDQVDKEGQKGHLLGGCGIHEGPGDITDGDLLGEEKHKGADIEKTHHCGHKDRAPVIEEDSCCQDDEVEEEREVTVHHSSVKKTQRRDQKDIKEKMGIEENLDALETMQKSQGKEKKKVDPDQRPQKKCF